MRFQSLPRWRRGFRRIGALLLALSTAAASAQAQPSNAAPVTPPAVRFGVLPIGGAVESRENWVALLNAMGKAIGQPIALRSVANYQALEQAIRDAEVDMAMLSGRMALDAVAQGHMEVLAEVTRKHGAPGHRAVLLARKAGEFSSLQALLAQPEQWRLARGDSRSLTGYVLPQLLLFLPHRIAMETRFKSELIDNHQNTALAVANGNADVATNNTTDFERFRQNFPVEAEKLHVIWQSDPTPPVQLLVRRNMAPEVQRKVQAFLTGYGKAPRTGVDAEREVLRSLRADYGYAAAGNASLLPVARLEHQLDTQRALGAQWVDAAARDARLRRIDENHARTVALLGRSGPGANQQAEPAASAVPTARK